MANIQEAIEYSKKNPTSSFANELKRRIESGQMDNELKAAGLNQYVSNKVVEPTLASKLGERAKTFGKETASLATLGASTLTPQDVQEGRQSDGGLVALQAVNRAAQSPIRMAGAVGGAIGDVVGAGLQATGLDKPIAQALQPIVESDPVQKAMQAFKSLPQDQQDVLGAIVNTTNIPILGGVKTAAQAGFKPVISTVKDIKNVVPTKLGEKAVDLISADPGKKVETILKRSTPEELNNYLSIAEKSSVSGEAKSVFEVVGDKLADTTKTLQIKLNQIGKAKSDIIEPMREGLGSFKNETKPFIEKLTSLKNSFSEIDKTNVPRVQAIIDDAKTIATKRDADIFIDKLQNALYSGNLDMTIPRGSALDKQLRGMLGEYNTTLKNSLPKEYSQLNEQYSNLIDSLDTINRSLGEVVEGVPVRGASLIKQYFSPSGSKAKEIFEFIKKETNGEVDLAKDATLAKFAGQLYDDANVNSLLGGIKDIPTSLSAATGRLIERVGGEKITAAMRDSTIRKAKEKFSPKLEGGSSSKTTTPVELKLSPSVNSTPSMSEGKGIRGFVNPGAFFKKNPAKVNSIVKDMTMDDIKVIADFQKGYSAKKLTESQKNAMNRMLEAMNIFVKNNDERATIGQMLKERFNSKK